MLGERDSDEEACTNKIGKDVHMKAPKNRTIVITSAATAILGLALISLTSCSSGDSSTPAVTTGGSAALQGPLVFVTTRLTDDISSGFEGGYGQFRDQDDGPRIR